MGRRDGDQLPRLEAADELLRDGKLLWVLQLALNFVSRNLVCVWGGGHQQQQVIRHCPRDGLSPPIRYETVRVN